MTSAALATDRPRPRAKRRALRGLGALGALAWLAIVAWNGWRLREDSRPLPSFRAVLVGLRGASPEAREDACRDYLRRSPNNGEARQELARLLGAREDYFGCAEQLAQVPPWWPGKSDALFREGQAYMLADMAQRAESAWLEQLAIARHEAVDLDFRARARVELFNLYAVLDRWEDLKALAWGAYSEATIEDRHALRVMVLRSVLERSLPTIGRREALRFLEADPADWESRRALARFEEELGNHDEADRQIEQCLRERPKGLRARFDQMAMFVERGEWARLETALGALRPEDKEGAEAQRFVALAAWNRRDLEGAERALRASLERDEAQSELHYRLGTICRDSGRTEEARRQVARSQELVTARAELPEALFEYNRAMVAPGATPERARPAIERLAKRCRTLGLNREAKALSDVLARP